ncbi:MAG: flagellar basal-body MS-ring/collar protein FliF [Oscillospiraceae bacterium]|nr:flagellar basal-body MS-ring/collar protein FliF [Oscillospiraceae bacterium]
MNEKVKSVVTTVKTKWTDASKMAKILIISIPVVVIAIIIILCVILNSNKTTAVLFSGLSSSEAGEIATAIQALDGAPEVTVNSNGDVIVPAERADDIRMQMWAQGYPKSTTNYDIWDNGVDLWSTDMDKREIKRQQLETRLGATIASMDKIQAATVNLTLPESSNYVISTQKGESQCAVFLQLRNDAEPLTNAEVRAIYRGVTTSVEGLTIENVSVMDSKMNSYEWIDPELDDVDENEDKSGVDIARKRLDFEQEFVQVLKDGLGEMFTKMYGENGFAFNVSARLNYDYKDVESTQYQPAEGTNAGVINHQDQVNEGGRLDEDGGLVGVTPDADLSPDYPTITGLEDGQSFYYNKNEIQYSVSNIKETIKKDGYSIDALTVGLVVNQTNMTEAEREALQSIVANAAGTTTEYVSVYNLPFSLDNGVGGGDGDGSVQIITPRVDTFRDVLLYVVVGLGVLLILLLVFTLFMGHSRKKKIRRRQEAAFAAATQGGSAVQPGGATSQEPEAPEEVDFNIASLTEEAAKESRETILKREISDFSKTNPEIVAQIIKNMMKDN